MKAKRLIELLQEAVDAHGDVEVRITRSNGKRTHKVHDVSSVGYGVLDFGDKTYTAHIGVDFEGEDR